MTEHRSNALSRRAKSPRLALTSLRHAASIATTAFTWVAGESSITLDSPAACGQDRWRRCLSKGSPTVARSAFARTARRSTEPRWYAGPAAVWVRRNTGC